MDVSVTDSVFHDGQTFKNGESNSYWTFAIFYGDGQQKLSISMRIRCLSSIKKVHAQDTELWTGPCTFATFE